VLVQLLSEPSGGSDLAGVITRADRVGDKWVINGAKTWSTSAFAADYGLMLARTDWDVPKHEGLTMFLVPINSPGITLAAASSRSTGSVEFCEEFFDNLELGDDAVVGEVNEGWHVAPGSSTTSGARSAAARSSPAASAPKARPTCPSTTVAFSRRRVRADNERAREMARPGVGAPGGAEQLIDHVYHGVLDGSLPRRRARSSASPRGDPSSGVRHRAGDSPAVRRRRRRRRLDPLRRALPVAADGGARRRHHRDRPQHHRRTGAGLPREYAADRGVPFNQVKRKKLSFRAETAFRQGKFEA
jgi:hypothetical protein